jgi:ABC-type sulfate/molybdate transport systems ATPase subunit
LSGGERQRLAIARAVAQDPHLLLLDEPFGSLDDDLKRKMLALVREIHRSRSLTALYVTHIASEVPDLASRVAIMQEGRIAETLPVEAFQARRGQLPGCSA